MEMRRKEREMADRDSILKIIRECQCYRIALAGGRCPYTMPVNSGYDSAGNVLCFHGAAEGRKMDLIRKNGCVGFEMDTVHELVRADAACGFSFRYRSIMEEGRVAVVKDPEEKRHGLDCIVKHMSRTGTWEYPDAILRRIAVIRLDVEKLCTKANE